MRIFRKLLSAERSKLRDHLLRLSRQDRLLRFSGGLSDQAVAAYCDHVDWQQGYVIGCFIEGTLRAVAELVFDDPHRPTRVDVAVSVETQWQDQGIAGELLRYAIVIARNRSVRTLYMICLIENQRMQHVARHFTDELHFCDGQAEADIVLPFPTYLSLCTEAALDAIGLNGALLEQFTVPWFKTRPGERYPACSLRPMIRNIQLLDLVAFTIDLPEKALVRGQVGTVVEMLRPGAYGFNRSVPARCDYHWPVVGRRTERDPPADNRLPG